MDPIRVRASHEYNVHIGSGTLALLAHARKYADGSRAMLVCDDTVRSLYGDRALALLAHAGFETHEFVFAHGEESKTPSTLVSLLETLADAALTRADLLVALGGGVTGDLAGLAASLYLRGIPFISLPTTLLSSVDSSVGGKTAVNLRAGKNLCGSFYQPRAVICDTDTFTTLPDNIFAQGVAEMIKYAMIADSALLELLSRPGLRDDPVAAVRRCVELKADFVHRDEFDRGERAMLNFGHTVAHAVELCSSFEIPHGDAVAIGMSVVTLACELRGICPAGTHKALLRALGQYSLPHTSPFSVQRLSSAIAHDKKLSGDTLTLIVPLCVGSAQTHTLPLAEIGGFLECAVKELQ